MRQLKTFMRNRKAEMLGCGPCSCRTLQCWRYANENCGCGGNSVNSKILNSIIVIEDSALFFTYNVEPEDGDDFWGVHIETDPDTGDSVAVVYGGGKYELGGEKSLPGVQMLTSLVEDMDVEVVKQVFFTDEEVLKGGAIKSDAFNLIEKLLLTGDEVTAQELSSAIENLYNNGEKLGDFDATTATIYFTQQSRIFNPKTHEQEEVKSDYVNLSKKSVTIPVGTFMKLEFSEDDKDIYFIFYDENETEIDRVASRTPSDNMQYIYYAEEGTLWEYAFEWVEERGGGYIVKSSTEVEVVGTAEVLMQVTIAVEPEGWGTTNYKKIGVPYNSQRTRMMTQQGTGYFKIEGDSKEFTISASPDTSIEKNNFFDWKVNGTWAGQTSDHRIQDDIVITAVFSDSGR